MTRRTIAGVAIAATHPVFLELGRTKQDRPSTYRARFRGSLDQAAIDDITLALKQSQPLGSSAFTARIGQMTGERRQTRPRGRLQNEAAASHSPHGQKSVLAVLNSTLSL
jgi:hypothetical protein